MADRKCADLIWTKTKFPQGDSELESKHPKLHPNVVQAKTTLPHTAFQAGVRVISLNMIKGRRLGGTD